MVNIGLGCNSIDDNLVKLGSPSRTSYSSGVAPYYVVGEVTVANAMKGDASAGILSIIIANYIIPSII